MHEEMHMTQMQFMNTGAREIVPFLDTTFGQHGARRMHLSDMDPPLVCQREGIKTKPVYDAYAKGTTRGCT